MHKSICVLLKQMASPQLPGYLDIFRRVQPLEGIVRRARLELHPPRTHPYCEGEGHKNREIAASQFMSHGWQEYPRDLSNLGIVSTLPPLNSRHHD